MQGGVYRRRRFRTRASRPRALISKMAERLTLVALNLGEVDLPVREPWYGWPLTVLDVAEGRESRRRSRSVARQVRQQEAFVLGCGQTGQTCLAHGEFHGQAQLVSARTQVHQRQEQDQVRVVLSDACSLTIGEVTRNRA